MTEGPLGGPRPLAQSDIEFVISYNEPVEQGRRSVKEVFEKVGIDSEVEMINDTVFIVRPENPPVTYTGLYRATRQLVRFSKVDGGVVGEMSNGTPTGMSLEMRCR